MSLHPDTVYFLVPGDITTRTGGYRYDRCIIDGLRARGWQVNLICLAGDYPYPNSQQLAQAAEQLARIPDDSLTLIDGLAYGVMPEQLAAHARRLQLIALVHHPLALETGNSEQQAVHLRQLESAALRHARRIITTSPSTAEELRKYDVQESLICAVQPGTEQAALATGSGSEHCKLLCVATLTPRKGHDVLLRALSCVQDLPWHLSCVGSTERDAVTAQRLYDQRMALGIDQRVSFMGEVDESTLSLQYQQADLFVLASFHEGYGMVFDEAIARGLPIIATDAGAIADTIPSGCGLLVPPGDACALTNALRHYLQDASLRTELKNNARLARDRLRSWDLACEEFENALTW
ncbi:MAG: glycosyltransferase family 4 protein [Granulosicoccus sp.]|nr:glycosyltransferase family 4 protein [Granulosicoccus sp.]